MNQYHYYLIIIILFILFLLVRHVKSKNELQRTKLSNITFFQNQCTKDNQCGIGNKCFYDSSQKRNVCIPKGEKICTIKDLTSCNIKNPNSCSQCSNNNPTFSCIQVSHGNPNIIQGGSKYTQGNTTAKLDSDSDRTINLHIFTDTNGSVYKLLFNSPFGLFKKGDTFTIEGGDNTAKFVFTTDPKPYYYEKDGVSQIVPDTTGDMGWCLPNLDETNNIQCNPNTGNYILVETGQNEYEWICKCKNPNFMDHETDIYSNCTRNVGCSGESLYIPVVNNPISCSKNTDCKSEQKCCTSFKCLKDNETSSFEDEATCYNLWRPDNINQDPTNGTCDCPNDTYFSNYQKGSYISKTCSKNPCVNGKFDSETQMCICDSGYYSCATQGYTDITDPSCVSTTEAKSICVPNPCGVGTFEGGLCSCPTGYIETSDSNVYGGKTCRKACENNGPCADRGTCVFNSEYDTKEICAGCNCPWIQESSVMCLEMGSQNALGAICKSGDDCCSNACTNAIWGSVYGQCVNYDNIYK